jgi:hypothetical protein
MEQNIRRQLRGCIFIICVLMLQKAMGGLELFFCNTNL